MKEIIVLNSDSRLPLGKRQSLTYTDNNLIPCTLAENDEDFVFYFDEEDLVSFVQAKALPLSDRYRLLANCLQLEHLRTEYSFSLAPDNLYYDLNLIPKVLLRDAALPEPSDFLKEYKCLAAALLQPVHSYSDYIQGGFDLICHSRKLKQIASSESTVELATQLRQLYETEINDLRKNRIVVRKVSHRLGLIALPCLTIISIACIVWAGYLYFFCIPFHEKLMDASNAFLNSDFLGVQNSLADIEQIDLPADTKYVLASAYVRTESLNTQQKEHILSLITPKTEEIYLDYWIALGRLDFDTAIDAAQRMDDDELLLLSYIKYEAYLSEDISTLSGEEKAAQAKELQEKINTLTEDIESARNGILPESTSVPQGNTSTVDSGVLPQSEA